MKLRTLILLGATLLALVGVAVAGTMAILTDYRQQAAVQIDASINSIHAAHELEVSLLSHNRSDFLAHVGRDSIYAARRSQTEKNIQRWLSEITKHINSPEEQSLVEEIQQQVRQYLAIHRDSDLSGKQPLKAYEDIGKFITIIETNLQRLVDLNLSQSETVRYTSRYRNELADAIAMSATIFLILVVAGLFFLVRRIVYDPFSALRLTICQFGNGDFSARAQAKGPFELKEIITVFNDMAETLQSQREAQLKFLASVAHDLRNPLSAIKMSAELLADDITAQSDPKMRILEVIGRQATYLDRMVGDLLDTTRIESGTLDLKFEYHDLREMVQESVSLYQVVSSAHKLRVSTPPEPVLCHCDRVRVVQVLNNLLSNAIKYSPKGGSVGVTVEVNGDDATIAVTDQGIGIASEDLSHIFEPFRRTSTTRETIPGVGLGLSVTRRIVEAHQGKIKIESQVRMGSKFSIHLPISGIAKGQMNTATKLKAISC